MATKGGSIAGHFYHLAMFFLVATIGFGVAFIVTSMNSHFFKWAISDCAARGTDANAATSGGVDVYEFSVDMEVDIGWSRFTVTYLDQGASEIGQCFGDLVQGESYPIQDYQDNGGSLAGLGMVASWGVGVLVAMYTLLALIQARHGERRTGVSLVTLTNWCFLFTVGVVTATTVFWWLVEGKFGDREEALAPRLFQFVQEGADSCSSGTVAELCKSATWAMDAPGWSLSLGVTSMFAYAAATFLLWIISPRVDRLNSGIEEEEIIDPAKPPVGNVMGDKTPQPEEKARAKDRRSAKTGVRAGKAPTSTVVGGADDADPDPMTYALEEGDEELGSVDEDDEEEVVYQNHQAHHAVINHSNPNPTRNVDDQGMSRQQYSRGYSRATSNASYVTGGQSFDEGQSEFSETASSAQYYAQSRGGAVRSGSFMSSSSRGDSFDEYR